MSTRYLILKNDKIIGHEDSVADVEATIGRDFRVKKQDVYQVQDLAQDEQVCVLELLDGLREEATPRKKIKFPPRKEIKFPARKEFKPIERKPLKRSTKPIPQRREKPRIGKNDTIDENYSVWLGQQPCVMTGMVAERGAGPQHIHCHHIKGRRPRNDYNQVPLMGFAHSWGGMSYHDLGKTRFLEKWKDKLFGVECIVEYFEDHAAAFKEQYDAEMKNKGNQTSVRQ
ncbi:MAG: hypothetical protein R8M46_02825 [Ghiorsea sp.]